MGFLLLLLTVGSCCLFFFELLTPHCFVIVVGKSLPTMNHHCGLRAIKCGFRLVLRFVLLCFVALLRNTGICINPSISAVVQEVTFHPEMYSFHFRRVLPIVGSTIVAPPVLLLLTTVPYINPPITHRLAVLRLAHT